MPVLKQNIIGLLNFRIVEEEKSSRLYRSMSEWLNMNGYAGAAKLWRKYSEEELKHANWAYEYLQDLNELPEVQIIPAPETSFSGLVEIVSKSFDHEVLITDQCQDLAKQAITAMDFMTLGLAQQYLKEQVEELAKVQYWLDRISAFGNDRLALRELDEEMEEASE